MEVARGEGGGRVLSRRELVRSAGFAGLAVLAMRAAPLQHPRAFGVTRHEVRLRGVRRPLSLALLTDLHLGPFLGEDALERWVDATASLEPDAVLVGGDIVDRRYAGDLAEVVRHLSRLAPPLGTYAVLGNHDHARFRHPGPVREALEAAGAGLLVNEAVSLRDDVVLAGLDDFRVGRPDLRGTLAAAERRSGGDAAVVLLSHNPDVIPEVPGGVDLLLAGHTHGGQVRLPLVGPVVTSSRYGRRYASGWVEAPFAAFVSRGLGVTSVPVRYDCPAELAYLTLLPA